MNLNLNVPHTEQELQPRIIVVGVGGAGGNAVTNMIQSNLEGVEFLVTNTDAQALKQSTCERRLQLGRNITQGLGAGSRPDVGRAAAEEALDDILGHLDGSHMVFITAGMGGGTGTGAAPVIARAAREQGLLTVGVVTKPFHFEGVHRMRIAENGIGELQDYVDTLIIIPNQNLFRVANEKTTFADAFKMADDVLYSGVRGVTDLMVMPGLINLDFADIRSVMTEMGKAMMGTGQGEGENRAIAAAEAAISNPLLDDVSMKGARGVLINITGSTDLTLFEVDEAANRIRDEVDPDANIIFGSTFDQSLEGTMRISVVATGIDAEQVERPRPVTLSVVSSRGSGGAGERPAATPEERPAMAAAEAAAELEPAEGAEDSEPVEAGAGDDEPETAAQAVGSAYEETLVGEDAASAGEPPADQEPRREREDVFVPPPPAQVEERPAASVQAEAQPEPFAAAAVTNGSREAEPASRSDAARSRASTLFARVTGAARAMQQSAGGESRRSERTTTSQPAGTGRRGEPTARPRHAGDARGHEVRGGQARLSGLDPADRLGGQPQEDDQLDIPAFLRRQAN